MCPLVCRTAKLNSKLSLIHLQQLIWDQTQINTRTEHLEAHACNSVGQFMSLIQYNPCDCFYLRTEGVTMLAGFPRTRWPRLRFSESYAVRISVKISRICEFRVIMGIMTGLLGCCSSSTLGSRANDYVKTLATLGFWLHHSPCSLGCWTNNTLAARSLSPNEYCLIYIYSLHIIMIYHIIARIQYTNSSNWNEQPKIYLLHVGQSMPFLINYQLTGTWWRYLLLILR